jgi:uracil-DNA glycosylase family 4
VLKSLEFNLDEILFTAAVRCKPQTQSYAQEKEIQLCGETVRDLIDFHQPDGIICLGDNAIKAVFPNSYESVYSIPAVRGSKVPYFSKSGKVITTVITFNPSFFVANRNESLYQVWYDDLASVKEPVKIAVDLKPNIILCETFDQIAECAERLKTESIVAFDFETTSLKPYGQAGKTSELYTVSFAFDDGTSFAIPLFDYFPSNMQKAVMELVGAFFYHLNPKQKKIGHNTKFDMLWGMYKAGGGLDKAPQGIWEDSSLLCWINDGRHSMSKLKVAAWRYLGVKNWSVDVSNVQKLPLRHVLKYNALDSFYTLRLYQHLEPLVCNTDENKRLYKALMLPAMLQFIKIEMRGVPVCEKTRTKFYHEYEKKHTSILLDIRKDSGRMGLNPGSPKQLQDYFLNDCGYKLKNKTKTGYSTDNDSMQYLVNTYQDGVAQKVMDCRAVAKLQSTYISGMSKHIYNDGRIHGGFNLTATITGRTSSNEPNMQNFPKRKAKEVRSMIVAPEGYKLCSFDYGQIEARLFAVVTADKQYLKDLQEGYDIHAEKALWVYRDQCGWSEEDALAQRGKVKNGGVFPAFYGAGDANIAESLGISLQVARAFKNSIFDRYPTVRSWQREVVKGEQQNGYIKSLYGRVRRSPIAYNELLNFTTQSTASDMTLTAMNFLGRKYEISFMIHDDLSMFIKDDEKLNANIDYICDAMLVLPWLFLSKSPLMKSFAPLQVECEVGDNWAEQQAVKSIDTVQAGYKSLQDCLVRAEEIKQELLSEGW